MNSAMMGPRFAKREDHHPVGLSYRFKPFVQQRNEDFYPIPVRYGTLWKTAYLDLFRGGVTSDGKKHEICMDMRYFTPKEIMVKLIGSRLVVEGNHSKKGKGDVSRCVSRQYTIPEIYDPKKIKCTISQDGILRIRVPKRENPIEEINVKVEELTGDMEEKLKCKL